MDSEAAVIRSEMTQTKAELYYKISQLHRKTKDLNARNVVRRYMPERTLDYAIGGVLTLIGAKMALGRMKARRNRRERLITSLQINHV
jgi:hypothetical protein